MNQKANLGYENKLDYAGSKEQTKENNIEKYTAETSQWKTKVIDHIRKENKMNELPSA